MTDGDATDEYGMDARLLGGSVLLLLGIGFVVYTFTFPIGTTRINCPSHLTHWELFGISLPIVRSLAVDPFQMTVSWYNGCNTKWTSMWIPLGGVSSLVLGAVVLVQTLRKQP